MEENRRVYERHRGARSTVNSRHSEVETFRKPKAVVGKCKMQSDQEWVCSMWDRGVLFKV